ncbi:hypothetical protein BC628DRAFT_575856 [Trametes gibbosa]|nr:hypothetical protein BC628DRAFT_575856 [Trametes gibbosa]
MESTTCALRSHGLLEVPDEIILEVIHYLDLQDITALRKTCKRLCDTTQDHTVWLHILRQEAQRLPLPHHITDPASWTRLSSAQLEATVRRICIVHHTWRLPRTHYFLPSHRLSCALDPIFDNDDGARSIYSIEILLDRWLLCIYHEKLVELWDLDAVLQHPHKPILCTSQNIKGTGSFTSAITHLDEQSNIVTIAVSCHELCQVLQVQLRNSSALCTIDPSPDTDDVHFNTIAAIPIPSPVLCLRALDPGQSLLLLSLPSNFHLLNWSTGQRIVVQMLTEEEEELWNGVVGAIFLTARHILVLKAHSIQICTLVDTPRADEPHTIARPSLAELNSSGTHPLNFSETHMCAMVHSHWFPSTTFRGVSFARPTVRDPAYHPGAASSDVEPTRISTSFLAFDVLRGLFHFSVELSLPVLPASAQPSPQNVPTPIDVNIQLLASHNMALLWSQPPIDVPSGGNRSRFSPGTRGFVSACALGPTGRRGVWVERRRGAVRRIVYGFDAAGPSATNDVAGLDGGAADVFTRTNAADTTDDDEDEASISSAGEYMEGGQVPNVLAGRAGSIDGWEVYEVNSYDLRDDITHVAFAEATGLIALGTRKGEIRVLGRAEAI